MKPGTYSGASCERKIKEPEIPPIPPKPTKVAEQKARFHWPLMLLAFTLLAWQSVTRDGGSTYLVRHCSRDIGINTRHTDEHTNVANRLAGRESHHREADQRNACVEHEHRHAHLVLVASPACGVHQETGQNVWRRDETLRGCY